LRGDRDEIARLMQDDAARGLPVWRGKPLFFGKNRDRAGWLPIGHEILQSAEGQPVFLGLDGRGARFAYNISAWEPGDLPDSLHDFFDPSQQQHPAIKEAHAFAELRGVMAQLSPRDAELAATARSLLSWHRSHRYCASCGAQSAMKMSGWQRDCPDCGAKHFPRTDPVVIMLITRGNTVLVGRSHGWPEGMYSLLAGFVEPGETIEAAVRREVFEETGIGVGAVEYLSSQPWPFPSSLMLGCRGDALCDEIRIDRNELDDAVWVTREEMMDVYAGNTDRMKPSRKGAIAHFLIWHWLADRLE